MRRGGQSFPAASRLRQRREFLRLERQGRRFAGIHFVLLTQLRSDEVRRLGVTASRRVGGSVVRNRVKRLVREVFRRSRESLPAADAVVIARPGAAGLSYGTVLDELTRLWKRAAERSSNR